MVVSCPLSKEEYVRVKYSFVNDKFLILLSCRLMDSLYNRSAVGVRQYMASRC